MHLRILLKKKQCKIKIILGIEDASRIDRIFAKDLSVEMRLLHNIISRCLTPKSGNFDYVNDRDITIMYYVVSKISLHLPRIMICVMKEAVSRPRAALPYGLLLTHIFTHFDVKVKGENVYNERTLIRMGITKVDGHWTRSKGKVQDPSASVQGEGFTMSQEFSAEP